MIEHELPFADALYQLNAGNRHGCTLENLEAEHWRDA
jgi:hypothetical protein